LKKVCVYTALVGAYDVGLPEFVNTHPEYFDFHCFTNQKRLTSNLWQMHHIEELPVPGDVSKSAYYYKWNPHKLFGEEYDTVIWMDSSAYDVKLDNIIAEIELFKSLGTIIHIEEHPSRSKSLKTECDVNCRLNKDYVNIMKKQVESYYKSGYKDSLGILVPETGFSIREFRMPECISLSEMIWSEMGEGKTKRDQLVWNYSVWKTNTKDKISMFSFEHKMNDLVKFKDHPHRDKHVEKVMLVGPWLGEDHIESTWINFAKEQISKTPIDTIIVGCKAGHEGLYADISPDKIVVIDQSPNVYMNRVDGRIPSFDFAPNPSKEIIQLRPTDEIMKVIHKPKINILWCTVRPQMMMETFRYWLEQASDTSNINLLVGVDSEEHKSMLIAGGIVESHICLIPPSPKGKLGVAWPSYVLSSSVIIDNESDIVVFASDDFYPMKNWDTEIRNKLLVKNGCLVVNDKLNTCMNIVSIPIMTLGALARNNKIIYNPVYAHAFSDNELYDNMNDLGLLIDISKTEPNIYIEHRHWTSWNKNRDADNYDNRNSSGHVVDRDLYSARRSLPIQERLSI
jgi:hypothetical protein